MISVLKNWTDRRFSMKSYLIYLINKQNDVNGDVIFASLLHLSSVGPIMRGKQNMSIVTIRRDRHLSRSL